MRVARKTGNKYSRCVKYVGDDFSIAGKGRNSMERGDLNILEILDTFSSRIGYLIILSDENFFPIIYLSQTVWEYIIILR